MSPPWLPTPSGVTLPARVLNLTTPNHEASFGAVGEMALERVLLPDMAKFNAAAAMGEVQFLALPGNSERLST